MRYIKYVKVFMLLAVVSLFAACSDDDVKINSNQDCTVGFANTELTVSEPAGYVSIPINVTGKRNGNVQMTIETAPVGTNGAVEGVNYLITDKTLNLNTDTLSSTSLDLELQLIDDNDINEDRQFTITIASAEGAEVTTSQMTVTIRDNDANLYERFGGTWTLTATNYSTNATVTKDIVFTCAEPGGYGYERIITATSNNLTDNNEELKWNVNYTYDETTNEGTLTFPSGTTIGSFEHSTLGAIEVEWTAFVEMPDGLYLSTEPITGTWSVEDDGFTVSSISFGSQLFGITSETSDGVVILLNLTDVTLTKKQ